jgi:hypothetical protein
MAGILDEISAATPKALRQPSPPSEFLLSRAKGRQEQTPYSSQTSYNRPTTPGNISQNHNSNSNYASMNKMPFYGQQYNGHNDGDEMEWTPIIPQKQNNTFEPRASQPKPPVFGADPANTRPSPFYGRLPEAPYSPAHRLRNPPNQARLRVSSQEVKENFFNNITRRGSDSNPSNDPNENTTKREMNLAQQRFFLPSPPSEAEAGNVLADLLTSFSLSSPETNIPAVVENRSTRTRHIYQALVLLLGMLFWNNSMNTEAARSVMLTVLIGCLALSIRTLLDNTVFVQPEKSDAKIAFGSCVASLEFAVAGYGLLETLASGDILGNWAAFGTRLTGGMLMYEIWAMSFGQ